MKLVTENIPSIVEVATSGVRLYGSKRLIHGFAGASVSVDNFTTTMHGAVVGQPAACMAGPSDLGPADSDWGEQDDGSGARRGRMPTSIRLAIDPTIVEEGDR